MNQQFEWNEDKAQFNLLKHDVSFEEAKSVFTDPFFIEFYDPEHSTEEERYVVIGYSQNNRLLFVSCTQRNRRTRLISARLATRREKAIYERD